MVELQMDLANESLDFHGKTWVGSIHFRLYNLQTVQKKAECNWNDFSRLNVSTMYNVRQWERFQFLMDYEHKQVFFTPDQLGYFLGPKVLFFFSTRRFCSRLFQMRWSFRLPTRLKTISSPRSRSPKCFHFVSFFQSPCVLQITFLLGLGDIGELRTLFAAEVFFPSNFPTNQNGRPYKFVHNF